MKGDISKYFLALHLRMIKEDEFFSLSEEKHENRVIL
jgi:hypothetical protein